MHTPGPWTVSDSAPSSVWSGNQQVAACSWHLDEDEPDYRVRGHHERLANARLIAAAPELLSALKKIDKAAAFSSSTLEFSIVCDQVIEEVRAAIAKAESTQP